MLASNNPGKLRELRSLLMPHGFAVVAQGDLGVTEVEEPHPTFLENALTKARHAATVSGCAALADDSGLCVDALGGAPGVHSARYAGLPRSDERNNQKLVQELAGVATRTAHYYCVLVLLRHPEDPEPLIAEGRWYGELVPMPRGSNGFGYDPYFFVREFGVTAAELQSDQKNQVSHRAQALQHLLALMQAGQ